MSHHSKMFFFCSKRSEKDWKMKIVSNLPAHMSKVKKGNGPKKVAKKWKVFRVVRGSQHMFYTWFGVAYFTITKNGRTKTKWQKEKKRVYFCDVRAVSHSCHIKSTVLLVFRGLGNVGNVKFLEESSEENWNCKGHINPAFLCHKDILESRSGILDFIEKLRAA